MVKMCCYIAVVLCIWFNMWTPKGTTPICKQRLIGLKLQIFDKVFKRLPP